MGRVWGSQIYERLCFGGKDNCKYEELCVLDV